MRTDNPGADTRQFRESSRKTNHELEPVFPNIKEQRQVIPKLSTANAREVAIPQEPTNKARPSKQAYLVFAVVGLALLMASIDSTIVAVGLPTLLTDLTGRMDDDRLPVRAEHNHAHRGQIK